MMYTYNKSSPVWMDGGAISTIRCTRSSFSNTPQKLHHHIISTRKPFSTTHRTSITTHAIQNNTQDNNTDSKPVDNDITTPNSSCIIFFKHDLRIDDHPGLIYALKHYKHITPVFCFDPTQYHDLVQSPTSAQSLTRAVSSLKSSLQQRGSNLMILHGSWQNVVPIIAQKLDASCIIMEDEVETHWRDGINTIRNALPRHIDIHLWNTNIFESYTDNYKEWKKQKQQAIQPYEAPHEMPALPHTATHMMINADTHSSDTDNINSDMIVLNGLDAARVYDETQRAFLDTVYRINKDKNGQFKSFITETLRTQQNNTNTTTMSMNNTSSTNSIDIDTLPSNDEDDTTTTTTTSPSSSIQSSAWEQELATEITAGDGPILHAIDTYIKYIETTADSGGSRFQWLLGTAIAKYDIPSSPSGCFPAIFNASLKLGVVSRRRVYDRAMNVLLSPSSDQMLIQHHTTMNSNSSNFVGNILSYIGWLLTSNGGAVARKKRTGKAMAAAMAAEAGDFHVNMAMKREGKVVHGGAVVKHFRWNGVLTDYLEATPHHDTTTTNDNINNNNKDDNSNNSDNAPAICLVHGFGAFSEHYRDNVAAIAKQHGFHVYAVTLPGYGRAEKPSMSYGQDLWRDFLADFVIRVIKKPVVVAGNSIGGFISASFAADYRDMVEGLVLINSAGLLQEGYSAPTKPTTKPSPPLFIVNGISSALFSFLEGDIKNQLKKVYPVVPDRADTWLADEIARAAGDPGALGVFRSVFYLPKPRALNYLVADKFKKPALVLQGVKDPLNDAPGRAKEIGRLCDNARIVLLDAGHTPHDEIPSVVNRELVEFVKKDVMGCC